MPDYEDLPILPGEESDLKLHVKACTMRFMALLKKLDKMDRKQDEMFKFQQLKQRRAGQLTGVYRAIVIAVLTSLVPLIIPALAEKFFGWRF